MKCLEVMHAHHSGAYIFIPQMMAGAQSEDGGPLIPPQKLQVSSSLSVCVCVYI